MLLKKKSNQVYFKGLGTLFVIFISILFSSSNVFGITGTYTLEWGNYILIDEDGLFGPDKRIKWSFSGSEKDIGIKVAIMDGFSSNRYTYSEYLVSDGFESSDKGIYILPREGNWVVVFYTTDIDSLSKSTTVKVRVNFVDPPNIPLILGLSIGIPTGVIVIAVTLVIILIVLPKRIVKATKELADSEEGDIFCWKCGSKNPTNQKHCGNCGVKLAKK